MITGIHHVTAMAEDGQKNVDFYVKTLGLRMIKKTVNFDDPGVYHLYYGDGIGTPGTLMTFFIYRHILKGKRGQGETLSVTFEVPVGSLDRWHERLAVSGAECGEETIFGKRIVWALDPDGLRIELEEQASLKDTKIWEGSTVDADMAIHSIKRVTLAPYQGDLKPTEDMFVNFFDWKSVGTEGFRERFEVGESFVDVVRDPAIGQKQNSAGTIHHIAFRNADDATQESWLMKLHRGGVNATPVQERNYFRSIYFREPGGVLFEFATDGPGFLIDEPYETLGENLMLPPQYENRRERLSGILQELSIR